MTGLRKSATLSLRHVYEQSQLCGVAWVGKRRLRPHRTGLGWGEAQAAPCTLPMDARALGMAGVADPEGNRV